MNDPAHSPHAPPAVALTNGDPLSVRLLTPGALGHLAAAEKWMLAGGLIFAAAGLLQIATSAATVVIVWPWDQGWVAKYLTWIAVLAWMSFFPLPDLVRSVTSIRRAARTGGTGGDILAAVRSSRKFWMKLTIGIVANAILNVVDGAFLHFDPAP